MSHTVAKGETVASIAQKYNVSESAILEENPILKNYIYVGMKIRIPNSASQRVVAEGQAKSSEDRHMDNKIGNVAKASDDSASPKKELNFDTIFSERQANTFSPHKTYMGFAFYLPTLDRLGSSLSAWGVDVTGFGYQFFLSPVFFVDASGQVIYRHINEKLSDEWQVRTNEFSVHFPIMLGLDISGFQLRAGGFLEYTIIGWQAEKIGDSITRTLYSQMKANSPNRFYYGARFDASFGFLDVGFILAWQSGVKTSIKGLSIGFKF